MDKFNRYHKTNIVASQLNQGLSLTKQQNVKITGHHKKECFIVCGLLQTAWFLEITVCGYLPWTRNDTLTIITLFSGRPWLRMICTRFQDCIHLQKKNQTKSSTHSWLMQRKKKRRNIWYHWCKKQSILSSPYNNLSYTYYAQVYWPTKIVNKTLYNEQENASAGRLAARAPSGVSGARPRGRQFNSRSWHTHRPGRVVPDFISPWLLATLIWTK